MTKVGKVKTASNRAKGRTSEATVRERILGAAFAAFCERGYAETSTLEIATRAKVSKRELYAFFDNKQTMLTACIGERAGRMRMAVELPVPRDRNALAATLTAFGTGILRGVSDPSVLAIYRIAITESRRSPEVARILANAGRDANNVALTELLAKAKAHGLFGDAEPPIMAARFVALLWGDLLVGLLLRVTSAPALKEMEQRAREAANALLALYPDPDRRTARAPPI